VPRIRLTQGETSSLGMCPVFRPSISFPHNLDAGYGATCRARMRRVPALGKDLCDFIRFVPDADLHFDGDEFES
jgi:hypothetical protein